jgi:hypothetical protein
MKIIQTVRYGRLKWIDILHFEGRCSVGVRIALYQAC